MWLSSRSESTRFRGRRAKRLFTATPFAFSASRGSKKRSNRCFLTDSAVELSVSELLL